MDKHLKEPKFESANYQKLLFFIFANFLFLPFLISIFTEDEDDNNTEKIREIMKIMEEKRSIAVSLEKMGVDNPPKRCDILAFKNERELEVWAGDDSSFKYIKSYKFTAYCGKLGPKLREGDLQIPEGEYKILYLNPESKYHLSMCINYPNEFDLAMAARDGRENPGSDICIHGKNVTIGCIPIGDEAIEELYDLVSVIGPDSVNVLIFPNDARSESAFISCPDCPDWTDSLYSKLKSRLDNYIK